MIRGYLLHYFCYYFILIQDAFELVDIKTVKKHLMTKEFTSFKNYLMDEIMKYHLPNEYFMMILFSKKLFNYFQNFIPFNFTIIIKIRVIVTPLKCHNFDV